MIRIVNKTYCKVIENQDLVCVKQKVVIFRIFLNNRAVKYKKI